MDLLSPNELENDSKRGGGGGWKLFFFQSKVTFVISDNTDEGERYGGGKFIFVVGRERIKKITVFPS